MSGKCSSNPAATHKDFCAYHPPYKSYTYSKAWVDYLVAQIADDTVWKALTSFTS